MSTCYLYKNGCYFQKYCTTWLFLILGDANIQRVDAPKRNPYRVFRNKRNVNTLYANQGTDQVYTIEVVVVVDPMMQEFHGMNDIKRYVLMLMSIASNIFADTSIGNLINLAVVDIILLENDLNVKSLYSGNFVVRKTRFHIIKIVLKSLSLGKYATYMLRNFMDHMTNKQKIQHDMGLLLTR